MKTILETWARNWRTLRAWRRPLEEIDVVIKGRNGFEEPGCGALYSSGVAYPVRRSCVIRAGADLPDALATILHEYAHLAAPASAHHGPAWSRRYAGAVLEVTGVYICREGPKHEIDFAATAAVRAWWKSSGNEFAAKLLMPGRRGTL